MPRKILKSLPGLLSWFSLVALTLFCLFRPFLGACAVIAFLFYWLFRTLYLNIIVRFSQKVISYGKEINWMDRVKGIDNIYAYWKKLNQIKVGSDFKHKITYTLHREELRILEKSKLMPPASKDIYHLVAIEFSDDIEDDFEQALATLLRGDFPLEQILVIGLPTAEFKRRFDESLRALKRKYQESFLDFLIFEPGKTVNQAAKDAAEHFREKQIPFANVIASFFKANDLIHHSYLSCLSYNYMVNPQRNQLCFQPLPVLHPDIWQVSRILRAIYLGAFFLPLAKATDSDNLIAFSDYSLGLARFLELNSESNQVNVLPLNIPFYIRMPTTKTGLKPLDVLCQQSRRLAKNLPSPQKLESLFKLLSDQISRATWPFILALISWIPVNLVSREFSSALFYYSASRLIWIIVVLVIINFISIICLARLLLPERRDKPNIIKMSLEAISFAVFFPLGVFISASKALKNQGELSLSR